MEKVFICIFKNSNLFLINNKLYFVLFIWLNIIFPINTGCPKGIGISNENCFNDLIIIKKYYKSGNFATNKKGDMIIEYSEAKTENKRLFYVGSSRAKLNLDLIVNGDESTIATIVDQLDFEPKKKRIAAIVKALDLKYNPEK